MAEDADDSASWILELESALCNEVDVSKVRMICKERSLPPQLRPEIWQVCLNVKNDEEPEWDDMYNLPEQDIIRQDCQRLVDRLGNDEEDKLSVVSDLESVVTNFSKSQGISYRSNNGWLELLCPLIALRLPKRELYRCFYAIQTSYIPRYCDKNGHLFHLLRLLLLYHDPELCSLLDTMKILPDSFASSWFRSMFSANCDLKVTSAIWDIYLQTAEPFFIFYLALVILVNSKEQILTMKSDTREAVIEALTSAPCALEEDDVEDFCSLARYYMARTPQSFKKDYFHLVFGNTSDDSASNSTAPLSQALCMPVSVSELLRSNRLDSDKGHNVRFFVVDCRPADQYNAGYLSTAFHLDASLMLFEPSAFSTAVSALLNSQRQAMAAGSVAGGEHLCFMGSGREEEDQYVHMVVASFLQKNLPYISLAHGGYAALHNLLQDELPSRLSQHNPKACIVCCPSLTQNGKNSPLDDDDISFIDKITSAMKTRTIGVKEKLVEYITNPQQPQPERHVSSSDRVGKRYRGLAPVFSIDGEDEDGSTPTSDEGSSEEVGLSLWLKKPEVVGTFKCQEVKENGFIYESSHLVVTGTHLYILRESPNRRDMALIAARRSLSSIVKITSKRRHPELITFKYGHSDEDGEYQVTAMDRLFIPDAGDATKLIKTHIVKLTDGI